MLFQKPIKKCLLLKTNKNTIKCLFLKNQLKKSVFSKKPTKKVFCLTNKKVILKLIFLLLFIFLFIYLFMVCIYLCINLLIKRTQHEEKNLGI